MCVCFACTQERECVHAGESVTMFVRTCAFSKYVVGVQLYIRMCIFVWVHKREG